MLVEAKVQQSKTEPSGKVARKATLLTLLVVCAVSAGVFFRVYNLDRREVFGDEAISLLNDSGHTRGEFLTMAHSKRVLQAAELQNFPNMDGSWQGWMQDLIDDCGQHPPLYYLWSRCWTQVFGNGIASARCLPALIGILFLPALYWMCIELFQSPVVAGVAVAIAAVSPFHVLQSQNVREYSLWAVMTALSTALVLRALRSPGIGWWIAYSAATAASFYTYPVSILVTIGQGLSVFVQERFRFTRTTLSALSSVAVAGLLFLPWLYVMIHAQTNMAKNLAWTKQVLPLQILLSTWVVNYGVNFYDYNAWNLQFILGAVAWATTLLAGLLVLRQASTRARIFLSAIWVCSLLPFAGQDLLLGGCRSAVLRYFEPSIIVGMTVLSFGIAAGIKSSLPAVRNIALALLSLLLIAEGYACAGDSQLKRRFELLYFEQDNQAIAEKANQPNSLFVIPNCWDVGQTLALSYNLKPEAKMLLLRKKRVIELPEGFDHTYLFRAVPGDALKLSKKYLADPIQFQPGQVPYMFSVRSNPSPEQGFFRLP